MPYTNLTDDKEPEKNSWSPISIIASIVGIACLALCVFACSKYGGSLNKSDNDDLLETLLDNDEDNEEDEDDDEDMV